MKYQDIHHWIRIFNSLNSNTAPLSSPTLTQDGFGSPNLGSLDENTASISATLGYPLERRRNQTLHNPFSGAVATVPCINPSLISDAAAALSGLNNSNNNNGSSGNSNIPPTTLDSHYRSKNGSTLDNRDLNLLQRHPLPSTTKEDIRRRAITEPNRLWGTNPQQQRGHGKHGPKGNNIDFLQTERCVLV